MPGSSTVVSAGNPDKAGGSQCLTGTYPIGCILAEGAQYLSMFLESLASDSWKLEGSANFSSQTFGISHIRYGDQLLPPVRGYPPGRPTSPATSHSC